MFLTQKIFSSDQNVSRGVIFSKKKLEHRSRHLCVFSRNMQGGRRKSVTHNFHRMDMRCVSLSELLSDMADTDVLKCQVVVQVVEKLSETRFVIADDSMSAKMDFHQSFKDKLGQIRSNFSITKRKKYQFLTKNVLHHLTVSVKLNSKIRISKP